jgi:phage terminase large subunit-like protein
MTTASELVARWRALGPVAWAESDYGWLAEDGQPIELAPWQRAALAAWWANRATVTTLALSNVKKTGKTLANAVLTAWRWLALPGEHFAAANDLDQSAGRQFAMIAGMVDRNPYLRANVEVSRARLVFTPTGSTLTALAADAAGNAGANFWTASHTEAWGVVYEAGIRSWEELTPTPDRIDGLPCLRIADSYAGFEAESTTWHALVDRGLAGERLPGAWPLYLAGGLLLFHIEGEEARARCFRGTPEQAAVYYAEQARDLRPGTFARMHGNQRAAGVDRFVSPEQWAACQIDGLRTVGRLMVLGADASTSRDLTALVGTAYNDAASRVEVCYTRVWKPERGLLRLGKPTVDLDETIGAEVLRLHAAGLVAAVVADPYQLHTSILRWEKAGIRVIELPQTSGRIEADQSLYDAIIGRTLAHNGEPTLTAHVEAAVAVETLRGWRLAKEKASRKIDAAVALSMSHYGALQSFAAGGTQTTPNFFYADLPPDETWARVGGRYVILPRANVGREHALTAEAVQACRKRAKGCPACMAYFEQSGEFERQELELAAGLAQHAGEPMTEEQFLVQRIERSREGIIEEEPHDVYKSVSIFRRNVQRRLEDGSGPAAGRPG